MASGPAAFGPARAGGGTAATSRKFTLAGVAAWIKLIKEDSSVALFDHDGGRRRLTHAGQASASAWLNDAVASQQRTGLTSRYINQNHKVDAVFYTPEGDMIELHDTADYQLQIDRKSTRLNSSHLKLSRMPSSA